jgi:hypothetical protein
MREGISRREIVKERLSWGEMSSSAVESVSRTPFKFEVRLGEGALARPVHFA